MSREPRAHVPAKHGKRVLIQPSLSRSRCCRATSMIDVQVTLSPSLIIEHAGDGLRGPDLSVPSSGKRWFYQLPGIGPGMGRPIDTGPVHRRQWRTGLVPLDILCGCQTMTWRALKKNAPQEPSVRLGVLGFCGRNTNDPSGLPGGSLLVAMANSHLIHIVSGRLSWGHDADHTPGRDARAILRWRILR